MLYMPRKAIHTSHEIGRTDIAGGTMGVNFTVGNILHAQVDVLYPTFLATGHIQHKSLFSSSGLIFTTVSLPHTSPVSFQSFVLQHLMLR
jgi:hypothetical protein